MMGVVRREEDDGSRRTRGKVGSGDADSEEEKGG